MRPQNIHLPSVIVNCALAGLYYAAKRKTVLPACGGLVFSAIVQGYRPPVSIRNRDRDNDQKLIYSAVFIGVGFAFSDLAWKTRCVAGSVFWVSQTAVKELLTQVEPRPNPLPNPSPPETLEEKIIDFARQANRIRPGKIQRIEIMEFYQRALKECSAVQNSIKAGALALVYEQFSPYPNILDARVQNAFIDSMQTAPEELDQYYQELKRITKLSTVAITTHFSLCEAFIKAFHSGIEGLDSRVGDVLLLYEDLIKERLSAETRADAYVRYIKYIDSQELHNVELFQEFRAGLGNQYKTAWLDQEGNAIYQKWSNKK